MIEARYLPVDGALGFVEIITSDSVLSSSDVPTVVCVHTAGQNGVQWRHVGTELATQGYRVIIPDLPGHGRSEPAHGQPVADLDVYADWILTLLSTLEVERPYVLGCSIGGKLALDLATRPEYPLAGAIVMEAEAAPGRVNISGLRRELEDVAGPSRAERTYLGTIASVGNSVATETAHLIALMHKREDPEISSSDLIGWGTHDVRGRLALLTCPLRLVCGTDDPWIRWEAVQRLAEEINLLRPGLAQFSSLCGVGHYPMEEVEDFVVLAAEWLADLRDASPARVVQA